MDYDFIFDTRTNSVEIINEIVSMLEAGPPFGEDERVVRITAQGWGEAVDRHRRRGRVEYEIDVYDAHELLMRVMCDEPLNHLADHLRTPPHQTSVEAIWLGVPDDLNDR